MGRVDRLSAEDIDDEAFIEELRTFPRNRGEPDEALELPKHYRIEAHFPEVMTPVLQAVHNLREHGELSDELGKKLSVVVSMVNGCQYCTGVYCTIVGESLGSEAAAREFQEAFVEGTLSGREGDIIEFAVKVTEEPHAVTDEDFAALRADHGLSDKAFVEIVYLVNLISAYNRITTVFDAEYEDFYHAYDWVDVSPESA